MPETASAVARFFLEKAREQSIAVTPMKLIKLVYIAHGWSLGLSGKPLINENTEAWRYGPVIRPLYSRFKRFGDSPIPSSAIEELPSLQNQGNEPLLNSVWEAYKGFTGVQLSAMTHAEGTPWWQIWHGKNGHLYGDEAIPNGLITDHYRELSERRR